MFAKRVFNILQTKRKHSGFVQTLLSHSFSILNKCVTYLNSCRVRRWPARVLRHDDQFSVLAFCCLIGLLTQDRLNQTCSRCPPRTQSTPNIPSTPPTSTVTVAAVCHVRQCTLKLLFCVFPTSDILSIGTRFTEVRLVICYIHVYTFK